MQIFLYIFCLLLFLKILRRTIIKLKVSFLKKEIKKNPLIGERDLDSTFLYKKNGYTLRYTTRELPSGEKEISWISYKYRLSSPEESIYKIKRFFQRLILYSRLKPSLFLFLFFIIIVVYIWVIIPESKKIGFYKFSLSRIIGIKPQDIEYIGGGRFEIYGKRIIPQKGRAEPFIFTINPLRWLFFSDYGYITRWRGKEQGGYITQYLKGDQDRISVKEFGRDIHGKIGGGEVKWDIPKRNGSEFRQDIKIKEGEVRVIDH